MGSRTMDAPSLGGRTVARHIAPKAVRQSRKRALRRAAQAQKLALARPDEQPKQRQVRQVPVLVGAQAQQPAKTAEQLAKPKPLEQPKRKWAFPRAAKPQPPAKPVEQPKQQAPAKPAEQPKQQTPAKPVEPPKQKPAKQPKQKQPAQVAPQAQEPSHPEQVEQVIDDPKPVPLDHLEDGVVDWGIKREE